MDKLEWGGQWPKSLDATGVTGALEKTRITPTVMINVPAKSGRVLKFFWRSPDKIFKMLTSLSITVGFHKCKQAVINGQTVYIPSAATTSVSACLRGYVSIQKRMFSAMVLNGHWHEVGKNCPMGSNINRGRKKKKCFRYHNYSNTTISSTEATCCAVSCLLPQPEWVWTIEHNYMEIRCSRLNYGSLQYILPLPDKFWPF